MDMDSWCSNDSASSCEQMKTEKIEEQDLPDEELLDALFEFLLPLGPFECRISSECGPDELIPKRKLEEDDEDLCPFQSCASISSEMTEAGPKMETKLLVKGPKQIKQMKLLLPPTSVAGPSVPSFGRPSLGSSFLDGVTMAATDISKRKVCKTQRVNELVWREVESFFETWIRSKERTDFVLLSGECSDRTRQPPFDWPRKRRMKKNMQDQVECVNLFEIVYKRCMQELSDGDKKGDAQEQELRSDIVTAFRKEIKRRFPSNSTSKKPNILSFSIEHEKVVCVCRKGDNRFSPIYVNPKDNPKRNSIPNFLQIVH